MHEAGLDELIKADLDRQGYAVQPFLSADEIQALSRLHHETTPEVPTAFYVSAFQSDAETRKRIRDGIVAILAAKLHRLLPGYRILGATFVTKKGGSGTGPLPLHQDYTFVDPTGQPGITVWSPLCDVDEHNGCLTVIGHSQNVNHIAASPRNPSPLDGVWPAVEANRVQALAMEAGRACFFDSRLLHGSYGNQSPLDRTVAFIGLIPENAVPRLHVWNREQPDRIAAYEIEDDFLLYFTPEQELDEQQKSRTKFLKTLEYAPARWTVADVEERLPRVASAGNSRLSAEPASGAAATIWKRISRLWSA